MTEVGIEHVALLAGQRGVDRILGERRADGVGEARSEEDGAADQVREAQRVDVAHLAEPVVGMAAVGVEPS